jgi:hypothetical protein
MPARSPDSIQSAVEAREQQRNDPLLRFVIASERLEEVVDPVRMGSSDFIRLVQEVGHERGVALFDYDFAKTTAVSGGCLTVEQHDKNGRHDPAAYRRLVLTEDGQITLCAVVANRDHSDQMARWSSAMVVRTVDIEALLGSFFSFTVALLNRLDPHKRHQRLLYNAALDGLQYRRVTRETTTKNSYTMNSTRGDETLVAFPAPRLLAREDLGNPGEEIARIVTLLERNANG